MGTADKMFNISTFNVLRQYLRHGCVRVPLLSDSLSLGVCHRVRGGRPERPGGRLNYGKQNCPKPLRGRMISGHHLPYNLRLHMYSTDCYNPEWLCSEQWKTVTIHPDGSTTGPAGDNLKALNHHFARLDPVLRSVNSNRTSLGDFG